MSNANIRPLQSNSLLVLQMRRWPLKVCTASITRKNEAELQPVIIQTTADEEMWPVIQTPTGFIHHANGSHIVGLQCKSFDQCGSISL